MRRVIIALAIAGLCQPAWAAEPPSSTERLVSLNFHNADLDAVLKFYGEVSGLTFIKSDAVQGQVTVSSPERVSLSDALKILESVLEVKGFALVRSGRIAKVVTQAEAVSRAVESGLDPKTLEGDRIVTQVIPLKFVSASEAKAELAPLILRGGNLIAHERTNTLVVTDVASNIRRLISVLDRLDVRTPQVLIDALIAEVTLSDDLKLGLEWSHVANIGTGKDLTEAVQQTFGLDKTIGAGLKYSVVSGDRAISATLQALEESRAV
ncbi:MAG: secretin N-terminal domain-containing protein, partial [bacterium]